jgi:hypothetical protein
MKEEINNVHCLRMDQMKEEIQSPERLKLMIPVKEVETLFKHLSFKRAGVPIQIH